MIARLVGSASSPSPGVPGSGVNGRWINRFRRQRRELRMLAAAFLVAGCGDHDRSDPPPPPDDAGPPARSSAAEAHAPRMTGEVRVLLDRWEAVTTGARELARDERRAAVDAFLDELPPDRLHEICVGVDGSATADRRALRALSRAAAGADPAAAEAWAALLADPGVDDACRGGVVMALQRARDLLSALDQALISNALLDLVEARPDAAFEWEAIAGQFGRTDRVRDRVEQFLGADDDDVRLRGARLGRESRDPRVGELLATYLYRLAEAPEAHPQSLPVLVAAAALRGQGAALPGLEKVIFATDPPSVDAVAALGAIEDERTLVVLENVYAARDRLEGTEREAVDAALHRAVRGLEPVILRVLRDGEPASSARAVRLLELASEVGVFARVDELRTALLDHASTLPHAQRPEVIALAERVGARAIPGGSSGVGGGDRAPASWPDAPSERGERRGGGR